MKNKRSFILLCLIKYELAVEKHNSDAIFQEFLKLTVDLVDLFGLHFIIQRVSGKSQVKVCSFSLIHLQGLMWSLKTCK